MGKLEIKWLDNCPACNGFTSIVTSKDGDENWLYEGDKVSCPKCGNKGVISVCDGVASCEWDD